MRRSRDASPWITAPGRFQPARCAPSIGKRDGTGEVRWRRKMQVVALIHEAKGVFGASFPDFIGCTTVANSLDAIIPQAAEALAFHVEGLIEDGPLQIGRTLAQLRKGTIFREAFAR